MIKDYLTRQLAQALEKAAEPLNLNTQEGATAVQTPIAEMLSMLKLERPRNAEHGDFAVNVSPLAKVTKMPPPKIADILSEQLLGLSHKHYEITVLGGFLNFRLDQSILLDTLTETVLAKKVAKNDSLADQCILLEYVSANPTGPLHIGHGRWAALGDTLVRLWRHNGATVTPEFYINDAGVQIRNIGVAVWMRALELLQQQEQIPADLNAQATNLLKDPPPYPGEYVIEAATALLKAQAEAATLILGSLKQTTSIDQIETDWLTPWLIDYMLSTQKSLLKNLRVEFEAYFSEKDHLHAKNLPQQALAKLQAAGFTYEQDGAIWFKTTDFGDEKDRVLQKSDGSFTYLTPDIAYHDQKFSREDDDGHPQYNRIINIWGADHHGYIPRMKAAIQALGYPVEQFEIILGQLVNLIVDGEKTRMGKRRKMLTLQDVVDEVGVDATRFFMVWKPAETTLDFDVDLALSATSENPVFYVQYAHARCCSILRHATEAALNAETGESIPAKFKPEEIEAFQTKLSPFDLSPLFDALDPADTQAQGTLRELILRLDGFEDLVKDAARIRAPHLIARYAVDLAADFHSFYNVCRIITDDLATTKARLMLIRALQKTLAQALDLLGVSAPERM